MIFEEEIYEHVDFRR